MGIRKRADRNPMPAPAPSPLDQKVAAVAERLHRQSSRQLRRSLVPLLWRRARMRGGQEGEDQSPEMKTWLSDKMVALDPEKAALCYQLCRSTGATRVVEAGTSYGVSTLYLASAVRDNGGGTVYGTEYEPEKAALANLHLGQAGLTDYVDVLQGDLRQTLPGLEGSIDFMLVDIWIPMALPALKAVQPRLRSGALVVCDNVVSGAREYRDYLDHVRDPEGEFVSVTIPGQGGLEISMKK